MKTQLWFVVPSSCDYIPTGVYNIWCDDGVSPFEVGTVIGCSASSRHTVIDYGSGYDEYGDNINSGTVIVFNPNKTQKPSFVLASFTTANGWERNVTMGTMPGTRTVIFNDEDGNGNAFTEVVNPFCADNGCTTFYEGTEFTLTPQPASGYTFDGWTGTGAGDITSNGDGTYTLIVGAKDYNISATWSQLSGGTITAIASPVAGGSVTVSPSGDQEGGTPVTLTPSNNPGYVFTGWDDNNDGVIDNTSNPRTVYVNDDHTYIAIFAVVRTITVSPDNASHGSTSGSGTYADGASVQISASGLNGYQFSEWDDGNSDNPRTITVSSSKTTYTASFILPGMTVGSCSDADISFHCDYGDIVVAQQSNYFAKYNQNSYCNNLQFVAKNSDNFEFELFFARNGDSYTTTYNGGECVSQLGPRAGNYVLWRAVRSKVSGYTYWRCYSGNTVVCYRNTSGYEPDLYSKIIDNNGNYIKLRSAEAGDGAITVSTNNVGGLFFETNEYVQNYDQNKSIYFTFGNRNEYTVSLGTGTMTLTSGITMSATNGSNSASIRLNNTTTGSKTLSDFNVANCHFTHNGNKISEISNMTGTLTESSGTYTLTVKIRDCQQNLYTVTMSAVAVTTYHLAWDAGDGELVDNAVYSYAVEGDYPGGEELPDGAPNATREGYQLTGWYDAEHDLTWTDNDRTMPNHNVTYTAQWSTIPYDLTYEGLEGATNTNPDTYNVESETIPLADPGARDGYAFTGWTINGTPVTEITHGSTGNKTLTANWNKKLSAITLEDNRENSFYNTFKTTYHGATGLTVTYPRQFTASRWSTMCLPFSLDLATMIANKMYGCVYEFKYATGNANVGSGVNLYFSNAKSIKAGTCYIVNANAALAAKTSFVFSGVTIDLSKDNGVALNTVEAYNALPGDKSQGTIELVGTLRNGTLQGSATGNTYMGLKDNKIYYPNTTAPGSTIWAYRGIFRSTSALNVEKMRIVVDGEDRGELIIDADGDILAPSDAASRKFIRDGVLYIEREGVIYDAQGKRVEGM